MKNNLQFDFTVDKETNTVKVTREFTASKDLVWRTWTEPELLDQWWGPKPFDAVTKSMNFSVGGKRVYAMVGPNKEEHWAFAEYTSINPKDDYSCNSGFCDSEGKKSDFLPASEWMVSFREADGVTTVYVEIKHQSLEELEKIIEMGFKEGFTACLEQLAEFIKSKK